MSLLHFFTVGLHAVPFTSNYVYYVLSSVTVTLQRKRADCFTLIGFLWLCVCLCTVTLPIVGRDLICGLCFWLYSNVFSTLRYVGKCLRSLSGFKTISLCTSFVQIASGRNWEKLSTINLFASICFSAIIKLAFLQSETREKR